MLRRGKALVSLSAAIAFLSLSSCARSDQIATETKTNQTIVSSVPPFQTKEPERYRATRTITSVSASGERVVTTNSIARDGDLRRDESEQVVYLDLPDGRFVLLPQEKLFAAVTNEGNAPEEDTDSAPDRLLHTEPMMTSYQKLGVQTIAGRAAQKYRVIVNNSASENVSVGETFIWVDEALHMPIRTESRLPDGTSTTTELSNVVLDVDKRLFQIPNDYKKIKFRTLRERLKYSQP